MCHRKRCSPRSRPGGAASERAGVAATAMQALRAARTAEQGDTVLEWIGVDGATYERALQEALTVDD